ncbi:hypothetical protein ACH5RR_008606 [Cinchona calisaya]|uniref:Uncharacterized protein n=1 Tax=Cinchona calisaya TaxID=153742 RepID=A0ABD3AC73_9GENT
MIGKNNWADVEELQPVDNYPLRLTFKGRILMEEEAGVVSENLDLATGSSRVDDASFVEVLENLSGGKDETKMSAPNEICILQTLPFEWLQDPVDDMHKLIKQNSKTSIALYRERDTTKGAKIVKNPLSEFVTSFKSGTNRWGYNNFLHDNCPSMILRNLAFNLGFCLEENLREVPDDYRCEDKDIDELMKEVQEARRIKMLHQPSKLTISKRSEMNMYELDGTEALGSYLWICPCSETVPEPSECSFQWYRLTFEAGNKELILGATKSVYAPEPFDVGRILQAEVITDGHIITVTTTGPIDPGLL